MQRTIFVVLFGLFALSSALNWNATLHMRLLNYAGASYCPQQRIQNWECRYCQGNVNITNIFSDSDTNPFGYAGLDFDNNFIIITFRGTQPDSLKNWITDLNFAKMTDYYIGKNAKVHSGFLDAYSTIRTSVQSAIKTLRAQNPGMQLMFIGHSLGAALSSLAAIDFAYSNPGVPLSSFNYGCPRVGNTGYAQAYSSMVPTFRVINQKDIVPHLPFAALGFTHPTQEVWFNLKSVYKVCSSSNGEDSSCADSIFPEIIEGVIDHVNYMGVQLGLGPC